MSGNKYDKVAYDNIPKALRSHSLFIAFAPVENPQIAIAVMMENDKTAKPIARKVMDAYFKLTAPPITQGGEEISGVDLMTAAKLTNTTEEHHEH